MIQVFLKILSMSAVGSAVILAVLLARLLLKKAPRAVICALWLVVLFRLLCPWSPESRLGGISRTASASVETREVVTLPSVAGKTNNEATELDGPANQPAQAIEAAAVQTTATRDVGWQELCCGLWLTGLAVLVVYSLVSLLRLKQRLVGTVRLRDNIYLADNIDTAFVLGLVRPKIYLPSSLSRQEQDYILAHEQTHIRRGDPWWKVLTFLALIIHWFNPLVWLAFVYFGKDMETACDEAVIRKLGSEIEADYAASLLRLATGRRILAGAPLAFGEGDTSGRIRHILRYKKPSFWVVLLSALAVVILGVFLAFDKAADTDSDYWNARYTVREVRYSAPMYDFAYTEDTAPEYAILPDGELYARDTEGRNLIYSEDWSYVGALVAVKMDRQERNALYDPSNNTVQEIMDDVTAVYQAQWQDSGPAQGLTHYLMVTRQEQLYLTVGSEDQVRWLFRLECQGSSGDMDYLDLAVSQSLGMDATGFSLFEYDSIPGTLLVGWTSGGKMGVTELLYEETDGTRSYTAVGASAWNGGSETGIYQICLTPQKAKGPYVIILSQNENLAEIVYPYDGKTEQETVTGCPYMAVLEWPGIYEQRNTIQYLDSRGLPVSMEVSDGLCVRGASWLSAIWPSLYPDGQVPAEKALPSVSLPAGQQMLVLELEDLDSETLTVCLSKNGGDEETTVLNRDRDGAFYLFLPEAQAGDTLLCRVIFADCCYAFRVVPEAEAESEYDDGIDHGLLMPEPDPYQELAYDLTDNGSLLLPVSELTGYSRLFYTNSTEIRVKNRSDSAMLHVELLTPQSGEEFIMLTDVEAGKTCIFTNLTSAQVYALRIAGDPNAEVEISD